MKANDIAVTDAELDQFYGCPCTDCNQEHEVTTAIRAMSRIDTAAVQAILNCLAAKMQTSGFSDTEIQLLDEAADFICGEAA